MCVIVNGTVKLHSPAAQAAGRENWQVRVNIAELPESGWVRVAWNLPRLNDGRLEECLRHMSLHRAAHQASFHTDHQRQRWHELTWVGKVDEGTIAPMVSLSAPAWMPGGADWKTVHLFIHRPDPSAYNGRNIVFEVIEQVHSENAAILRERWLAGNPIARPALPELYLCR